VATAVMQRESHVTRQDHNTNQNNDRDTLLMLIFGAGLILSNPVAQGYLSRLGFSNLTEKVLPDLERYLKLRAM
jgi:hypothetical protein